jgi:DNA-binding PadR family transcriptional regulator
MPIDPNSHLPLAPATLQILLALSGEDLHGYGIMQEVRRQTAERYNLGPGTLYDNLQRLEEQGLVKEVAARSAAADARRKYYRLSPTGQRVLAAEVERLEGVVREAKLRQRRMRGSEA